MTNKNKVKLGYIKKMILNTRGGIHVEIQGWA